MPIGILVSLLVCTVLYMVFAHVMTGVEMCIRDRHQAYPCIGRKEQHHAKASKNTQYGDKWNKWGFKGTGHVRDVYKRQISALSPLIRTGR